MATLNLRMRQRYETAADWTSADPILLAGEEGIESDTGKRKVGNGSDVWSALVYSAPALNHASQHETGGSDPIDALTFSNTGLKILDTVGDHELIIAPGDDLNADRTLSIIVNDADRILSLGGNVTFAGATTVTAAAATVLDDASVSAMVDTLGGASATGSGGLVRATSPTLVTPALGTPASGVLTNCTGLPLAGLTNATADSLLANPTGSAATPAWTDWATIESYSERRMPYWSQDFSTATSGNCDPYLVATIASGTTSGATSGTEDANHPGQILVACSTSANSGAAIRTDTAQYLLKGGEIYDVIFFVSLLTNSTFYFGFHDATSATEATDGFYGRVVGTTLDGRCANGGSRTSTGTTYTLSTGVWYRLRVSMNTGKTTATFTLTQCNNGTQLWSDTVASNIPGSTAYFGNGAIITNNGLSATNVCRVDYQGFGYTSALTR